MNGTKYCKNNILNIFFKVNLSSVFVAMTLALVGLSIAFSSLYNGTLRLTWFLEGFSDFVVIMEAALDESPYLAEGASYPPLAIMILYPFAYICKDVFAMYAAQELNATDLTTKLAMTPQFWVALFLYFAISIFAICLIICKKYGFKGVDAFKVCVTVITCAPFVFTILRGNTIFFALIFLLLFLLLKDSDSKPLRELSYVCLAIAGCIKIYPLFFGVFLLKEKKLWASVRVAVYFFAIFFFSFFLFERGTLDISSFYGNLGGFMTNELRLIGLNNVSLSGLVYKILYLFVPSLTADDAIFKIASTSLTLILFAVSTFAAIYTKNKFTRSIIASATVILVPSISYFYVLVFMIIPFMEYLDEAELMEQKRARNYFIAFMFLFLAFLILPKVYLPHSLVIIAMLIAEIIRVFKTEVFKR